jgi:hypothetical protein
MLLRRFALAVGIVYVLVGVLGFIPALVQPPDAARDMAVAAGYGRLLGLFPINVVHNVVHVAIGAWGLAGSRSFAGARGFARGLAVVYGVLAVLGRIPATETLFGLAPLYGHDIWLHAGTALVAAYFGFGPPARDGA